MGYHFNAGVWDLGKAVAMSEAVYKGMEKLISHGVVLDGVYLGQVTDIEISTDYGVPKVSMTFAFDQKGIDNITDFASIAQYMED